VASKVATVKKEKKPSSKTIKKQANAGGKSKEGLKIASDMKNPNAKLPEKSLKTGAKGILQKKMAKIQAKVPVSTASTKVSSDGAAKAAPAKSASAIRTARVAMAPSPANADVKPAAKAQAALAAVQAEDKAPQSLNVTGRPLATAKVVAKEEVKDIAHKKGDFVVYPTHGVGKVVGIETQQISGHTLQVIIIHFDKDRMTLRVPVAKARHSGLRRLATRKVMDTALQTLKGRSRVKRAMWSRRAQEYEAKINSGDPVSIAEVVRDLHRNADQPDQSYSERQIYQAALDRLVRELAAIDGIDEDTATERLHQVLKAA